MNKSLIAKTEEIIEKLQKLTTQCELYTGDRDTIREAIALIERYMELY